MSDTSAYAADSSTGTTPEVSADLKVSEESKYAIASVEQAVAVADQLRKDWEVGIVAVATITAQLNGQRPRPDSELQNLGKSWMPNMSVGWLRNECSRIPSRFFMPVLTAQYLTAAELPAGWPLGQQKAAYFRAEVSETIRSWNVWSWFMWLLSREVGFFGFGFAAHFEEYEWRPTFVRQDRGFVPIGTPVTDQDGPASFLVDYDYQPFELLEKVEKARKAKYEGWNYENVAAAICAAKEKSTTSEPVEVRKYEEMTREMSNAGYCVEKRYKVVETQILFTRDADGTITKQILTRQPVPNAKEGDGRLLFERREYAQSMNDVVQIVVFDPDTGTVHGSWGAGQMLFDISLEAERSFNDMRMAMKLAALPKAQAAQGGNVDSMQLVVSDALLSLAGGTFAGNLAAFTTDPKPFIAELEALTTAAREKIGNYIPPVPLTSSDVKAAQINAKEKEQQERREQALHIYLAQIARVIRSIVRRLTNEKSPDEEAKSLQERLLKRLTREEIRMLADQQPINTIFDFTEFAQSKRAAFAASKVGSPFYDQKALEQTQAIAAGGVKWAESVLLPGGDATLERAARREQAQETVALLAGYRQDVLPYDSDWFHLLELRPVIEQKIMAGEFAAAAPLLAHYTQHHIGAVAKQGMPKDKINASTSFITRAGKAIETMTIPPEGLADKLNPIDAMNAQIGNTSPLTLSGPTEGAELAPTNASEEGLDALVQRTAA